MKKKNNNINANEKTKMEEKVHKKSNDVLAIVVTYNRKELLLECIDALKNLEETKCDILIVNNASTDDTEETILKMVSDDLMYVNTGANLGGAGGFNFGIRYAVENYDYKYVWLMDDDTIVSKTSLNELMKAKDILKDDFGFLSSKALWKDGSYCLMNRQMIDIYNWHKTHDYIKYGLICCARSNFCVLFNKNRCG